MTWRVTHVSFDRRRRQALLECDGRSAAEALAAAMFGPAFYLAVIRLRGR
jgi:hypothetical protein